MGNMWRCPDCETNNTGEKCMICGYNKPKSCLKDNPNIIEQQPKIINTDMVQQIQSIKAINEPKKTNNKKKFHLIITCFCSIMLIILVSIVISVFYVDDDSDELINCVPSLSSNLENDILWDVSTQLSTGSYTTTSDIAEKEIETSESTAVPDVEEEFVSTIETKKAVDSNLVLPSLLGKNYTEAIRILETMGISYSISFSDKKYVDVDENCVYSQSPKSGTKISDDEIVKLGISTYKETITQTTSPKPLITTPARIEESKPNSHSESESSISESFYTPKVYTVNFFMMDDVVTEFVEEGEDATPPDADLGGTFVFIGWDGDYTNVTEDRNITAIYEIKEEITTTTVSETEIITESNTKRIGYDGNITLLLCYNSYSLSDLNVPIEGTTWEDYYWQSDNEYCIQIISGSINTYCEGDATLTLTYIYDTSIVATAKVRVVSYIE